MKLTGKFRFVGVERRQGFKDPSKSFCVAGFAEGLDVLRVYLDDMQYSQLLQLTPYEEVEVVLDYNPASEKNPMKFVEVVG